MQRELEKGCFTIDVNGESITYDTVLTFYNTKNGKNYVVYSDSSEDDENLNLYASIYDPNSVDFNLIPVETDEEWKNINEVVKNYFEEAI